MATSMSQSTVQKKIIFFFLFFYHLGTDDFARLNRVDQRICIECWNYATLLLIPNKISTQTHPHPPHSSFICSFIHSLIQYSKFEEVSPPTVDDFEYIADHTYTKLEIFEMENNLLNVLEFSLSCPTINCFLRRYLKASCYDTHKDCDKLCYFANVMNLSSEENLSFAICDQKPI